MRDHILNPDYEWIKDSSELQKNEAQIRDQFSENDCLAVDTETTGLDPHTSRVRLLQIGSLNKVWIFDCFHLGWDGESAKVPTWIREYIEDPRKIKILHNSHFDWKMMAARLGVFMDGVFDTFLASRLLAAGSRRARHSLGDVVRRELDLELPKEMQRSDWSKDLNEKQLEYAARDVAALPPLRDRLKERLIEDGQEKSAKIEFYCAPAVAAMEFEGLHISKHLWNEVIESIHDQKSGIEANIRPFFPAPQMDLFSGAQQDPFRIDIHSSQKVKKVLERQIGEPLSDTTETTLKKLAETHPIAGWIFEYRQLDKLTNTYGQKFLEHINPKTNRIHAHYQQISAASGRMSCSNPNIQQIPKSFDFRKAICAPEGSHLIVADYSQIELRVAAVIAEEKKMLEAFDKNEDLHRLTASEVLKKNPEKISSKDRQAAKAVNFGFLFGMGSKRFKDYAKSNYGVELSDRQAEKYRSKFFEAYPALKEWHRTSPEKANESRLVRTLCGRKTNIPHGESWYSAALNLPVQGTAAEGMKYAMGKLYRRFRNQGVKQVAMIHDELIFETPKNLSQENLEGLKTELQKIMGDSMAEILNFKVPIEVEAKIADSWSEK